MTLTVEGRIVSDWVAVLERECHRWLQDGRKVRLDFSGVTFVDRPGVEMLKRLQASDVRIVGCSVFVAELLKGREVRETS